MFFGFSRAPPEVPCTGSDNGSHQLSTGVQTRVHISPLPTVYSYYSTFNDGEYKVSIVMTTRTTVGSAYEKSGEPTTAHATRAGIRSTTTHATTDDIRGSRKQLAGRQK